jgi:hypothetical protein
MSNIRPERCASLFPPTHGWIRAACPLGVRPRKAKAIAARVAVGITAQSIAWRSRGSNQSIRHQMRRENCAPRKIDLPSSGK